MLDTIIIVLIVVVGFCTILWLFLNHIKNLEILIKSKDIVEYTQREIVTKAAETKQDTQEIEEVSPYKDITEITAEEAFKPR